MYREGQINVNERIRRFKSLPQNFKAAKTVDDPFVIGKQRRVRSQVLDARDFNTSRSVLEFVKHRERQSGDCSKFTGKR